MIIGDMEIRLRADIARLQRDMDDARRVVGGAVNGITEAAKMAKGALVGMAAGVSFAALVHQVVDAQREFDKLNASLITATGSTANAAVAFKALQSFAATTPYSVQEATEAFIKMRNLGLDPSERALRSYGNTAAAMGKGLNQMIEAVADAATGEFERLKEFGITAKQNGDRVALTFKGMTTNIGNNAKEIQGFLRKIGETDFGGGMELRAATLDGAISNLGDTWQSVLRTISSNGIGEAMLSGVLAVSGALQDLSAILDAVGGAAGKEGQAVKEATGVHAILTTTFEALAVVGTNIAYVFQTIGKDIGAFAAQAVMLFDGGMKGLVDGSSLKNVQDIGRARVAEAEQERKAVDAKSEAILGAAQKSQAAQDAETSNAKKNGTDRLAQFQLELTDEQKRQKALNDTLELRNRLNGVNAQTAGELTKLKTALDTGAISQAEYNRYVAQVNKEATQNTTVYKNAVKQIDLQTEALQRQAAARAYDNQQAQQQIDFLKRTGQMNEEDATDKSADADLKTLRDQRDSLAAEKKLQSGKIDNLAKVKELQAQIDQVGKDIGARELKRGNDLFELDQKRYRQAVDNSANLIETEQAELASLKQQTQAQIDQNEQIGLTQKQVAELTAKYLEVAAARKDAEAITAEGLDLTGESAQRIRDEAAEIRKRSAAIVDGAAKQELYDKTIQDAQALVDIMSALDSAAQSAAQGMAQAFGSVGQAIGSMTTALTGYERTQAAIAAQLLASTKDAHGDPAKIARANQMAVEASAQAQIKSYGDMAGAAKGFFKENSTGYKVMGGLEKAYRAAEMAMALEAMAKKIFFKETEVAANTTLNATKIAGEATATAASTGLAATEASAWGITAVIKAIASMPFPMNLVAGAVTLAAVAGLGVAMVGSLGGGSTAVNPNSAEERQKVQGTGTVLGDPTAKSESIANSLEIMKKNSELELDYQNSMLTALQNIASALGGAAKGISQTAGITGGSAFGTVASADKAFVGASHTKDITDSGVQFSGTFGQLRSGAGQGRQYEDVYTTSDGGMFRSGWTRTDTNYKALSAEAMKPFSLIFDNMGDLLVDAGAKLGEDSVSLTNAINSISVDFGVSLRGLSGQDLTDALNAGVSVAFDKVTTQLFPTIQQFQKMGEGLGETLVRVASDVQGLGSVFASMGKSFGTMSIEAKERLVEASGGLDKFASSAKSFMQNFYSEDEQRAATKAKLNPLLAKYGLSTEGPAAQKMFRDFVVGLDASTAAGAATYAMLMNLQQAFFDVTDAAASQRKDLQEQLDQLTMTSAQLLAKQRDALDDSNKALFDQVQAAQKVKDAQDAAKSSLGDFIGQMKSFAATAKGLNNSLALGSLSTLTPEQQYAEARRQFEQTRQQAAAGDTAAQGSLQSVEQTFLQLSQRINGGDAQYSSDLATVMRTNDELAQWATQSVDVAQASLDALDDSSATLTDISATLTAIAQGVQYLPAALSGQDLSSFAQALAPIDYSRMGTLDMAPLVAEVKALREEVKGLRADAERQTGDKIKAGEAIAQQAAETVVEGVRDAVTDGAYASANSTRNLS
jgi:hypothetical protein